MIRMLLSLRGREAPVVVDDVTEIEHHKDTNTISFRSASQHKLVTAKYPDLVAYEMNGVIESKAQRDFVREIGF